MACLIYRGQGTTEEAEMGDTDAGTACPGDGPERFAMVPAGG